MSEVIVLKFGSSVLRANEDLPIAVHEIYRWLRDGRRVVAVVSAIGDTTDRLLDQARALSSTPEAFAMAELLATGERSAAALLGLALDRGGIPARVLNPREIGLTVVGPPLDSELVSVDAQTLRALLEQLQVLVIPGFFGTDAAGRTHCLGRGGSDLTAVFLAHALGARCRLIKDIDGVYESDPADEQRPAPRRFVSLNYVEALRVARPLIQPKAVSFLQEHKEEAEVAAAASFYESTVGTGPTLLADGTSTTQLKVVLFGLGTVGRGVRERLLAAGERFRCLGILVRSRAKHSDLACDEVLHTDPEALLALHPDVVVDALPRVEPSRQWVLQCLRNGTSVVSTNKALISEYGVELAAVAEQTGATLRYSAAVGGGAWMIEAVERAVSHAPVVEITAVLNGTCNFVLDQCAHGASLEEAISGARRHGFAEADPSDDLSGTDSCRKLRILARHAFGAELTHIESAPLDELIAREAHEVSSNGQRLRQVARAWKAGGRVVGAVKFERFTIDNPFGALVEEWNALEIHTRVGRKTYIVGRGAGRWPTTEAVMADLFGIWRERVSRAFPLKPSLP